MSQPVTWFGAFDLLVSERSEILAPDVYGSFVNVVGIAATKKHFLGMAHDALEEDGYEVLEVEEIQQIDLDDSGLPYDEIQLLKCGLNQDPLISYGVFHTYPKDGLDA